MLVLTRKVGEGIAIGDDIKVVVMQIKGKQVRLGVRASANTIVHREEVYQRIQEENKEAAQALPVSLEQVSGLLGKKEKEEEKTPFRRQVRPSKKAETDDE